MTKPRVRPVRLRGPFDPSDRSSDIDLFSDSLTHQSFKDDCDINNILQMYETAGFSDHVTQATPAYLDVSDYPDYQTAMNEAATASRSFYELSPKIRARFNDDPAELLKFVDNPDNDAEAISLGLKTSQEPAEAPSPDSGDALPQA